MARRPRDAGLDNLVGRAVVLDQQDKEPRRDVTSVVRRHGDDADRQLAEAPKDTRSGLKVSGREGDRQRRPGAVPGAVLLVGGVTLMPR